MTQTYKCLPTDLWTFDPTTPKGFYFNRGVYYFGRLVSGKMDEAEAASRKNRKAGPGTDALVAGARLGVLEKYLGIPMKRFREPDRSTFGNPNARMTDKEGVQKDESTVVWRESG